MTRTFVVGETTGRDRASGTGSCVQALERGVEATRPGASGRAIFDGTCELFERHGYPTLRTKKPGETLDDGFFHGLGHGVGLEVHEAPGLGMTRRTSSSPATSSRSSPASTGRASAASGSRT